VRLALKLYYRSLSLFLSSLAEEIANAFFFRGTPGSIAGEGIVKTLTRDIAKALPTKNLKGLNLDIDRRIQNKTLLKDIEVTIDDLSNVLNPVASFLDAFKKYVVSYFRDGFKKDVELIVSGFRRFSRKFDRMILDADKSSARLKEWVSENESNIKELVISAPGRIFAPIQKILDPIGGEIRKSFDYFGKVYTETLKQAAKDGATWKDRANIIGVSERTLRRWREEQSAAGARERFSDMGRQWQPDAVAVEILLRDGVNDNFIKDAIPEFVLYWTEKGVMQDAWNSKFIAHVQRQWLRLRSAELDGKTPRPLAADWKPNAACLEILQMARIDEGWALQELAEFVLYWRDTGEARESWNIIFLQRMKQLWAQRLKRQELEEANARPELAGGSVEADDQAWRQRVSDRSWAE